MGRRRTVEDVRKYIEDEGYVLIDKEYCNARAKLTLICPNGHECKISFDKWMAGRRCLCESGKNRLDIVFIEREFSKRGYKLLSKNYKNRKKLVYLCPNGHKHSIRWDHFKRGHGCPYCAGKPVIDLDSVKNSFAKEGYELLDRRYVNSSKKLNYVCPNGHEHSVSWRNWNAGHRCPECSPNMKKDIEFIGKELSKEGYSLMSSEYSNHNQKLHAVCPNGHDCFVTWNNWSNNNSRCVECTEWGSSCQEREIIEFLKLDCGREIIERDRNLIKPYELDVVIPESNLAIEYCGLYWHSDRAGKNKTYHLDKLNLCNSVGYRLITVFEDEWVFNKKVVKSRLRKLLNVEKGEKVLAEKCHVEEITDGVAEKFCNDNHLQGYGINAAVKIGLFHENELVSAMTFSKQTMENETDFDRKLDWKLHRFCSKTNFMVVGGAYKLLKHFENNYKWRRVRSYVDRRWSSGDEHDKLNFLLVGFTGPNCWYVKNQKRVRWLNFRKKEDGSVCLDEWGIKKSQGWSRIWDCGNAKFDKTNNKLTSL
jgi:hypothetical protein